MKTIAVETCRLGDLKDLYDLSLDDMYIYLPSKGGFLFRIESFKQVDSRVEVTFPHGHKTVVSRSQTVILVSRE